MTREEFIERMNNGIYFKAVKKSYERNPEWVCFDDAASDDIDKAMFVELLRNDAVYIRLGLAAITLEKGYMLRDLSYSEEQKIIYSEDGTLQIELG